MHTYADGIHFEELGFTLQLNVEFELFVVILKACGLLIPLTNFASQHKLLILSN